MLAGCDALFGLEEVKLDPDAPGIDAATICEHGAPFTSMVRVPGLSDSARGEIDVWLSRDEQLGIVTIGGPNFSSQMHYVQRVDDSFAIGSPVTTINARSTAVGSATVDGLYVYYEAFYANVTGYDIERAFSPAPGVDYSDPTPVPELNYAGGIYDQSPTINNAGTRIYWVSSRSMEYDVWSAVREGTQWTNLEVVYVGTMRYERYLVPSADDLALYFGSSANGIGSYELRVVTRLDTTQPFSQPTLINLPEAVTTATPAWISDDNCRMYLAAGGDIWLATRVP